MFFYYLCKRNMSKITAKECQNVEYKRSWKDEYLKWICGFANAQ
jgi:ATP-dependent DNA helicase RecG